MKAYNLIFVFSKTGEVTLVRTMPDGRNKGLLNGIGGNTMTSDSAEFFDTKDSKCLATVHVMDITFHEGCTPDSKNGPILLHIHGHVYDHLKLHDTYFKDSKADQVTHKATYDALIESMEKEMDKFINAEPGSRKYVPGYGYFLSETYAAIMREKDTNPALKDFAPITGR